MAPKTPNITTESSISKDCLWTGVILMVLFSICSFATSLVPFGAHMETILVQEGVGSYKYWLLISILVSAPSLLSFLMDLWQRGSAAKTLHLYSLICRSVVLLSIVIPNTTLLVLKNCSFDSTLIFQIQNSTVYAQFYLIVGIMFCTILGSKNEESSVRDYFPRGERYVVGFLVSLFASRLLLVVATVLSGDGTTIMSLSIASAVCFAVGLLQILFVSSKVLYYLWQQSSNLRFQYYNQMHDFYRILATTCYAVFTFIWYFQSNLFLSPDAVFYNASNVFVNYLMGLTVLVIFLNLTEERCYVRDVQLKEEQLQSRLNLMRYISHEMRSPLSTVLMGLQLLHNDITGVISTIRKNISILRKSSRSVSNTEHSQTRKEKLDMLSSLTSCASTMKEVLDTCDMVKESSSVALETLNDMLTFDKIDDNKLLLEVEDLNVWDFVSETVKPFNINAIKAQVSLTVEYIGMQLDWMHRCTIKADKFKLNQVLRNFVSNALKFCSPSKGEVKVVVERIAVPRRLVRSMSSPEPVVISHVARVSVSDNGGGISEENQKKLFGKHVQFNAGQLQKGGGSGLGLWISKSLVELHGGTVGVFSQEGHGSTFFFELPLFATLSPDDEIPYEEVYPSLANNAEHMALVARSMTAPDIETGDLQQDKPDPTSMTATKWWQRSSFSSSNSVATFLCSTIISMIPPPVRIEPFSDLDSGILDARVSQLAPNGLKISMGSFAERRRQLVANLLPSINAIDFKDDDSNKVDEKSDDSKVDEKSDDKAGMVNDGSSHKVDEKSEEEDRDVVSVNIDEKSEEEQDEYAQSKSSKCLRFLVVDDTAATRKLMRRVLTSAGHTVDEADDGLAFLQMMGYTTPNETNLSANAAVDVILMDDNMPNLSGPEATAAIRAAGYGGLIFGVTGNSFADQVENFKSKGADLVFTKPLNMSELYEAIKLKLPMQ